MVRVRAVRPLEGFDVEVTFTNGTVRRIDLEPFLHGPVFEPLRRDPAAFRAVYVVQVADAVHVLHAFQKKSKAGIATPQPDVELVEKRLKAVLARYGLGRK